MINADAHDPEYHRRRYATLLQRGRRHASEPAPAALAARNPDPLPEHLVIAREVIPGGWYWSARLARGETLRIVNASGTPGVAALFWNADDPSERFYSGDTMKIQWTARLGRGRVLFSDMGRVLASITDDTCGVHDALVGGASGHAGQRNSRDNFLLAVAKHGLGKRDIPPCITFFAGLRTGEGGRFAWIEQATRPGDYVDLRAEMNLRAVLSNCPHPLAPAGDTMPRPVEAVVWRSPPPAADDLCRTWTDEAVRGFENTDRLFRR
jgi:urea carboxylase-associated protein 2